MLDLRDLLKTKMKKRKTYCTNRSLVDDRAAIVVEIIFISSGGAKGSLPFIDSIF
jgi:hypothetical protein